jgi:hypothetical protein
LALPRRQLESSDTGALVLGRGSNKIHNAFRKFGEGSPILIAAEWETERHIPVGRPGLAERRNNKGRQSEPNKGRHRRGNRLIGGDF